MNADATRRKLCQIIDNTGEITTYKTLILSTLMSFKMNIPGKHNQLHGCMCPGDARRQVSSIHVLHNIR